MSMAKISRHIGSLVEWSGNTYVDRWSVHIINDFINNVGFAVLNSKMQKHCDKKKNQHTRLDMATDVAELAL